MNINHFENDIAEAVLTKGYDYYIDDRVVDVYHQGDREYICQVEGGDHYEIVVKLGENGDILYSHCDCPYSYGPICKHKVAAYYELSDMLSSEEEERNETEQPGTERQPVLKEVLNQLSKDELIAIILEVARGDAMLRNSLLVKYAKGDDKQELENCRKLIQAIARKYTGRDGFIPYGETYDFTQEMSEILEKARGTDNLPLALDITLLLLEETMEAFEYADDSDGDIGVLADEALELIGEIAGESRDLDADGQERVFNKLIDQIDGGLCGRWDDYRNGLLEICAGFADVEAFRSKLRAQIEHLIRQNADNEYKKYSNESMLRILFGIIQEYSTPEESEHFITENLRFPFFREWYMRKFMEAGDFHKVIDLALEGEAQDEALSGLVFQWKKIRYDAYTQLSLKEEQIKLAKELLLDGHFEYYSLLKQLIGGDKKVFYRQLKQELMEQKGWRGERLYLKLVEAENDLDGLVEYVRQHPDEIETYAGRLTERFKDEVLALYQEHIRLAAKASSTRKHYRNVCGILTRYKKLAGETHQQQMVDELMTLYSGRPAFLEELSKI